MKRNTLGILRQYFSLVLPFVWQNGRCLLSTVVTLLLTCVDAVVVPMGPWLFSVLIRDYKESDGVYVWKLTGLLTVCWFLGKTVRRVRSMVFFHVVNQAISSVRLRLVTHFHQVALDKKVRYDASEVLSASTRVSLSIRFCLRIAFLSFIPTIFKLLTCAVAMQYAFDGSGYFLGGILMTYVYVFFVLRKFTRIRHGMWEISDRVMVAMGDSLRQRDFAALHPVLERERLRKLFDEELKGWGRENWANNRIHLMQNMLFFFVTGGFFFYLMGLLQRGVIDVPKLVLLKGYIFVVYREAFHLTEYVRGTSAYVVDMRKVLDILGMRTEEEEGRGGGVSFSMSAPVIRCEGMGFAYGAGQKKVLDQVSLVIEAGDRVAITGASGSGKSTLARLLAGLYLPMEGDVFFRGVSTRLVSLSLLGEHVYCIGQDDPLMSGSIKDQLMVEGEGEMGPLYGLKDRMDVSQGGGQLSGGEKQRVLLARCLSHKPDFVILDEAFSYLDEASGRALLEMVLAQVPTVVLMTHRREFLGRMNRVYALVNGSLVVQ